MINIVRDIRHAVRSLIKTPGFSLVAIATLALGIGGTTAVFSLVNGIILKPLSYPQPGRLVFPSESFPALRDRYPFVPVCANHFETWRDKAGSFSSMAAIQWVTMTLNDAGAPAELGAAWVSADFFGTLGVPPRMGRDFADDDDQPGSDDVIIITDRLWRGRLGASSSVLGQTLRLDGKPYEIIGVLPPEFRFPRAKLMSSFASEMPEVDLFKPIAFRNKPLHGEYRCRI